MSQVRGSQLQTSNFKLSMLCFLLFTFCSSCSSKPDSKPSESSTKFQQYIIQGEQLYLKNCSNCHQKTGTGLGLLYPPLNKSDFMDNHFEEVICLMKNGKEGELIVNGKSFNKQMKGISTLTDLEIAEIATYIFNTWEHQRGLVDVQETSRILSHCDSASLSSKH
ncbi:MAG: cytochrome c [Chryseolinea sp.]